MTENSAFLRNKTILVTGGLGFIGLNLIKKLFDFNIKPIVFDNRPIDNTFLPFDEKQIIYHQVDLRDSIKVSNLVSDTRPDYVIHLAGMTNLDKTFENAELSIDINLKGSLAILKGLANLKIENFVFLSTSDIYGQVMPPFRENQLVEPASPYSASKAAAEMFLLMFSKVYTIPVTILRSFNVYGKFQPPVRVIPYIIEKLLKDETVPLTMGEQKREFNYVDDLLSAIFKSMESQTCYGKVINIGCGESISIKEIALLIAKKLDKVNNLKFGALDYRKNEIWDMYCDNSLARKYLNWYPEVSLEEGLDRTIEWYKNVR